MKQIKIIEGNYKGIDVSGKVFKLAFPFKVTDNGNKFVTVFNDGHFANNSEKVRIKCNSRDSYQYLDGSVEEISDDGVEESLPEVESTETDEEIMVRIRKRFEMLMNMTKAATNGEIRAMIVSGPPGVGKSFGVEQEIEKAQLIDQIAGRKLRAEVVKGSASPVGLYSTLYKYSDRNSVLVFDDCDSILMDDVSLNLLKGALDSGKKRKISWLSDSSMLRREGIPGSFNFNGSVIFITNLKFDKIRSHKLRDHLDALQSRCHYLDLTLDSEREKLLRIRQIAGDGELFNDYDLDAEQQAEIIEFMDESKTLLRELSLRMALKIADLRISFPDNWKEMVLTTCVKARD
jgi:hypothetical protein